jgi:hypothetical protein
MITSIATYGLDPDVQNWLNQLTVSPSNNYISNLTTLVVQLKAAGIWGQLDRMWIFATEQQQHARISIVNPTSSQITEVNSPTWTTLSGYTGNGSSSYLNTNYNPNSNGVNYTLNNVSYGAYILTNIRSTTQIDIGCNNTSGGTIIMNTNFSVANCIVSYVNDSTGQINGTETSTSVGLTSAIRTASSTSTQYRNGVNQTVSNTPVSTAVPNINIYILAENISGSANSFSTRKISMVFFGSGSINQLAFYNAFQIFAIQTGFNV